MADFIDTHQEEIFKRLLKKYDKNGDGKITKEDFKKAIEEGRHADRAQHLLDAFDAADANKNGILDLNEVGNLIRASQPDQQEQKLRALLKKFDKNGDGKITKEDFQKVIAEGGHTDRAQQLLEAFDKADANKNGVIDADEVKALLAAARQHHK